MSTLPHEMGRRPCISPLCVMEGLESLSNCLSMGPTSSVEINRGERLFLTPPAPAWIRQRQPLGCYSKTAPIYIQKTTRVGRPSFGPTPARPAPVLPTCWSTMERVPIINVDGVDTIMAVSWARRETKS
jgi:hypothetical protein